MNGERPEVKIVLASASPRRRELLGRFGLPFEICPAAGPELAPEGSTPGETVKALAAGKAAEIAAKPGFENALVIAADTVVAMDGLILGKPRYEADAFRMLSALSGREHSVFTGVCLQQGSTVKAAYEETRVRFRTLSPEEIKAYIATGEPMDKAGAYGYQGLASVFVEKIDGDYFNVVGLPLCRLERMLRDFHVSLMG